MGFPIHTIQTDNSRELRGIGICHKCLITLDYELMSINIVIDIKDKYII